MMVSLSDLCSFIQFTYYYLDAMDVDSNIGELLVSNLSDVHTSYLSEDAMNVDP